MAMADLERAGDEAAARFADNRLGSGWGLTYRARNRRPKIHLLLGDSIARRAKITSKLPNDVIFSRARSSEKWDDLRSNLTADITAWETAAAAEGLPKGLIIVWLTGNDVYSKLTHLASWDDDRLLALREKIGPITRLLERHTPDGVLILGPLPRIAGEVAGDIWEKTAAYKLERTTMKSNLGRRTRVIPLGRAITVKMSKKNHGMLGVEKYFRQDGVHLSRAGYIRLQDSVPIWLRLGAALQ